MQYTSFTIPNAGTSAANMNNAPLIGSYVFDFCKQTKKVLLPTEMYIPIINENGGMKFYSLPSLTIKLADINQLSAYLAQRLQDRPDKYTVNISHFANIEVAHILDIINKYAVGVLLELQFKEITNPILGKVIAPTSITWMTTAPGRDRVVSILSPVLVFNSRHHLTISPYITQLAIKTIAELEHFRTLFVIFMRQFKVELILSSITIEGQTMSWPECGTIMYHMLLFHEWLQTNYVPLL